jgi:hypothetical protein
MANEDKCNYCRYCAQASAQYENLAKLHEWLLPVRVQEGCSFWSIKEFVRLAFLGNVQRGETSGGLEDDYTSIQDKQTTRMVGGPSQSTEYSNQWGRDKEISSVVKKSTDQVRMPVADLASFENANPFKYPCFCYLGACAKYS